MVIKRILFFAVAALMSLSAFANNLLPVANGLVTEINGLAGTSRAPRAKWNVGMALEPVKTDLALSQPQAPDSEAPGEVLVVRLV